MPSMYFHKHVFTHACTHGRTAPVTTSPALLRSSSSGREPDTVSRSAEKMDSACSSNASTTMVIYGHREQKKEKEERERGRERKRDRERERERDRDTHTYVYTTHTYASVHARTHTHTHKQPGMQTVPN